MERKGRGTEQVETAHALAAIGSLLLMPLLRRLPSFSSLLIAGIWTVLVLFVVARAIVRSRAVSFAILAAIALAVGWLIWFTYQY
jgi:hypothetical protein